MDDLTTESHNERSRHIDSLSSLEIARLMNDDDKRIAVAIESELESIGRSIDVITSRLASGGRLVYMGAGTSGRLGVLDASECPPTFSTPPEMVVGLIAGGHGALVRSVEGAEDRPEYGRHDLEEVNFGERDVLVGIATSGRTPYVVGGLQYARELGATTIGLACNEGAIIAEHADIFICPVVGPEVVSGSTRLKAGTATKMVLNMLTTGAMVRLGKTFGHLMVDLTASNEKLMKRSCRIVCDLTSLDEAQAARLLEQCGGELKTAVVAQLRQVSPEQARVLLSEAGGHLRQALDSSG